jgi:hypothetical protein
LDRASGASVGAGTVRAMGIRFNHMELTFPTGALTDGFCEEVTAFYGDVFGFTTTPGRMFDQRCLTLRTPDGDFLLLIEGPEPMRAPGFDHLGFRMSTRGEVDESLAKVKAWAAKDDRVRIQEYPDGVLDGELYHAFYVRHLLPIWFDVQHVVPAPAATS